MNLYKKCNAKLYSFLVTDTTLASDNPSRMKDSFLKYEFLTGEEILPFDQSRKIEQAKFTYSPLDKLFGKQIKTIEDQEEKQRKVLEKHGKN